MSSSSDRSRGRVWIGLALGSLGAWAIMAQSIFIREALAVFFGNELAIGLTLSAWFLGIFCGAAAGSVPVKTADLPYRVRALALPFLLLTVLMPLAIIAIRASRLILDIPGGELVPFGRMFLVDLMTVTPCAFLIGYMFPVASTAAAAFERIGVAAVSRVYVLESCGSLAGGMLFTLAMLPRMGTLSILAVLGILAAFSLAPMLWSTGQRRISFGLFSLAALLTLGQVTGAVQALERHLVDLRWRSYRNDFTLVSSVDSPYQNISVAKDGASFLYTNGQISDAFPDEYAHAARTHPLLLEHPRPRSVLLIGGGTTGMLREVLLHPVQRVCLLESDPWIIKAVLPYLPDADRSALVDPRVRVVHADPRRFVLEDDAAYDLVILNLPDPTTAMLNRFYTKEFYEQSRMRLAPRGVLITRISSNSNYLGGAALGLFASTYWTLRDVFPHVLATPGEESFLIASDDPSSATMDVEALARRWRESAIDTPYFHPAQLEMMLPPDRIEFQQKALESERAVSRNTDLRPVTYFYGLILWDRFSGGRLGYSLTRMAGLPPAVWGLLCLAPVALWGIIVMRRPASRRSRHIAVLAITTTGFASISWSLLLMLTYQDIYGSLYQEIALLVAILMLGLAIGAEGARRWLTRNGAAPLRRSGLRASDALLLLFAVAIVPGISILMQSHSGPLTRAALLGLLFLSGALSGAQFPMASHVYLAQDSDVRRAAGRIDAADHVGALAGAFLVGLVLIPLGGLLGAAIAVAAVKLVSLACLLALVRNRAEVSE